MKFVSLIVLGLFNLGVLGGCAAASELSVADAVPATAPAAQRLVLPLDHGPRAQSTPWFNEQLRQRALRQQHEQPADSRAASDASAPAPAAPAVQRDSSGH
jgi:hypothetical protein